MRIGVDATCWANGRGYGRFIRHLLPAMVALDRDDEFICFLDSASSAQFDLAAPNVRRVEVALRHAPTQAAAADDYRAPLDMLRLTRAVGRESLDVFFSPTVYTYFPLPLGLRAVVTVHDAIADRYPELTLPSGRARLFWRLKVSLALAQARLVLTVSDYARREIEEVLRVSPSRIRVALEAPAESYRPSESSADIRAVATRVGVPTGVGEGGGGRWFTYVGGFNPHKHVDLVIRALDRLAREFGADTPYLLLVGRVTGDVFHGDQGRIRRTIADLELERLVKWTGFLSDADVRQLHSGAVALLLPSQAEGFGLPAVEAAACGAPVIATTASPLPELLAGGGFFVPPGDLDALTDAMRQLARDPELRDRMGQCARVMAGRLSWPAAAQATLSALAEAAA